MERARFAGGLKSQTLLTAGQCAKDCLMRFALVTTCNLAGWQQYGRRMVETFDQFWPADVPLYLYAEDFLPDHPRPIVRELPKWLGEFKARHANNPPAHGMINGK